MLKLVRFKLLLNKYKTIFSDILGDMHLEKMENDRIIFKNRNNQYMTAVIKWPYIGFYYRNDEIERHINFKVPEKCDSMGDIKVLETIKEIRNNGCIIEKIERIYGFSRFSDNERVLVDLISKRYAFSQNIDNSQSDQFLEKNSILKTIFESHMEVLFKASDNRWYTDSPYSSKTLLNGEDISYVYDIVNGKDKISRIYDLYNGIINKRNGNDIFSIHLGLLRKESFGYKETRGIAGNENEISGKPKNDVPYNQDCEFIHDLIQNRIGYNQDFNCSDLSSLLHAITYAKPEIEPKKELCIPSTFAKNNCNE